jgi:GT2 family glycosyltransferase
MSGSGKENVLHPMPKCAVIILNFNGWIDTLECLESVFRLDYPQFQVVVCDAGSTDRSLERIKEWANGKYEFQFSHDNPVHKVSDSALTKPIAYKELRAASNEFNTPEKIPTPLVLIDLGKNLGFAGGNNFGIRYVLFQDSFEYVWILNNDTVVHQHSLLELVERMHKSPACGLCGSTIFYYYQPELIQSLGGNKYNKWLAISSQIKPAKELTDVQEINANEIEQKMDMVHGSTMFVSVQLLHEVGLLSEEYYLFSEEIDWATRSKGKYALGYAPKSIIYHKRGHSTGNFVDPMVRSSLTDFYNIRSRILFTRKFYPYALPSVYLGLIAVMIKRLRRMQFDRVKMIFLLMFSKRYRITYNPDRAI